MSTELSLTITFSEKDPTQYDVIHDRPSWQLIHYVIYRGHTLCCNQHGCLLLLYDIKSAPCIQQTQGALLQLHHRYVCVPTLEQGKQLVDLLSTYHDFLSRTLVPFWKRWLHSLFPRRPI